MRIAILAGELSARGGGIPSAVLPLCRDLAANRELSITVFGTGQPNETSGHARIEGYSASGGAFAYSRELPGLLDAGLFDLVHTHGLWTYASVAATRWRRRTGRPIIISPHGMLDGWALRRSRTKKRVARALFEDSHIASAACMHALNREEAEAIRQWGYRGPIAVVPNGIDLPSPVDTGRRQRSKSRTLLFLGRIDPKKGVRELIQAWGLLKDRGDLDGWKLVIAGWGQDQHVKSYEQLAGKLGLNDVLVFAGPQYGEDKHRVFTAADAFVLPSFSEGMPMTILEAWAFGLPVLMTRACNLDIGFQEGAAIEIVPNPQMLADQLSRFMRMPQKEAETVAAKGRQLVEREFSLQGMAVKVAKIYQTTLSGDQCSSDPALQNSRSLSTESGS